MTDDLDPSLEPIHASLQIHYHPNSMAATASALLRNRDEYLVISASIEADTLMVDLDVDAQCVPNVETLKNQLRSILNILENGNDMSRSFENRETE